MYNEMGDGWLWVKSLRTKESGIIFSALVEDMTKNADPNEGKGEGALAEAYIGIGIEIMQHAGCRSEFVISRKG